ncbi:hypothetical protein PanWU01x14_254700 [Parasponia andersonii]|uniref:Uncharacterized protein n=1 Tax=Parasponia andersonii TaxID=3476 RepID=A0A2P5BB98_PARAD|nr:hypothetical protein PanWU01x14_254700 [Parasponia andersonii]
MRVGNAGEVMSAISKKAVGLISPRDFKAQALCYRLSWAQDAGLCHSVSFFPRARIEYVSLQAPHGLAKFALQVHNDRILLEDDPPPIPSITVFDSSFNNR